MQARADGLALGMQGIAAQAQHAAAPADLGGGDDSPIALEPEPAVPGSAATAGATADTIEASSAPAATASAQHAGQQMLAQPQPAPLAQLHGGNVDGTSGTQAGQGRPSAASECNALPALTAIQQLQAQVHHF